MMVRGIKLFCISALIGIILLGCSNKNNSAQKQLTELCEWIKQDNANSYSIETLEYYYYDDYYYFEIKITEQNDRVEGGVPFDLHLVYALGSSGLREGWFTPESYEIQGRRELHYKYTVAQEKGTHYVYSDDELRKIEKKLKP